MDASMMENTTNVFEISFGWLTIDRLGIISGIVIGVIALAISRQGILPNIEFQYEIKAIDPKYVTQHIQKYFFERHKEKYGDMYSHLTLVNGGNGKASDIEMAYNYEVNDKVGGFSDDALHKERPAFFLIYENYLFSGHELVAVPALDLGSGVFEEAKWILIRARYNDCIAGSHCKCALFVKKEERGFDKINLSCRSCTRIKQWARFLTRRCNFREDVCSTDELIQVPEEEKAKFEAWMREKGINDEFNMGK